MQGNSVQEVKEKEKTPENFSLSPLPKLFTARVFVPCFPLPLLSLSLPLPLPLATRSLRHVSLSWISIAFSLLVPTPRTLSTCFRDSTRFSRVPTRLLHRSRNDRLCSLDVPPATPGTAVLQPRRTQVVLQTASSSSQLGTPGPGYLSVFLLQDTLACSYNRSLICVSFIAVHRVDTLLVSHLLLSDLSSLRSRLRSELLVPTES